MASVDRPAAAATSHAQPAVPRTSRTILPLAAPSAADQDGRVTDAAASAAAAAAAAAGTPMSAGNAHRLDLSAPEYFDVRRADGSLTGEVKLRSAVHRDGDWHAAVHIWLLHSRTGQILLQQRSACKDSFPSCWDVSCAGHLSAGETPIEAAEAELAEELGIRKPTVKLSVTTTTSDGSHPPPLAVPFESFCRPLVSLPREVVSQGGKFIDREHTFVYLVEGAWSPSDFTLQVEEVAAVKWVELEELIEKLAAQSPGYVLYPDLAAYTAAVFEPMRRRIAEIRGRQAEQDEVKQG